jgi:RecB family exonuclease
VPPTLYSHSPLSSFENCPRQFEYRYVQRIPRDTESVEAYLGKRVHEILERLYHHMGRHGRPPSLRQVLDRYRSDWSRQWHDKVHVVRDDRDTDFYRKQGERCLENYYRGHYPFDEGETVGLEKHISIRLDDESRYRARGIIDRLVRKGEGRYEIHDYKSGGYMPPREKLERDRQLSLYQIGVEQSVPDAESVELVWHYLNFGKTVRITRTPEKLEDLRVETIGLIDVIERSQSYPARPGPLCRWCEYRDICADAALGGPSEGRAEDVVRSPGNGTPTAQAVAQESEGQLPLL